MRLGDVDQYPVIDVTIDGADECVTPCSALTVKPDRLICTYRVDKDLNAIKGGGACHLREKVLAEAADTFIIVADYRKNSEYLGTNVSSLIFGLPTQMAGD